MPLTCNDALPCLFGFHWHRPIQARANSPMVCSGCCSVFRRDDLMSFGGFPELTIVEDMLSRSPHLGELRETALREVDGLLKSVGIKCLGLKGRRPLPYSASLPDPQYVRSN
ncbi:hypothetical protein ACFY0R_10295 [Streptomyces sp. NPDC001633]|uniref:hypothetical protein n=1 Tax=Streptomyces sp. NPDC001633 TaxID=3364595 RepID=UPI0036ACF3E4